MCQEFNRDRRRFLSMAGVTIGGARFGAIGAERVQSASTKTFGELKQVNAGILNVGYAEVGPAVGPAVVLLHGWPYDIHSFIDVAPLLATRGFRVLVPYLRGYGTTRNWELQSIWRRLLAPPTNKRWQISKDFGGAARI
jgi:hypothetical protein